jgi:serine/threonine protein kinase
VGLPPRTDDYLGDHGGTSADNESDSRRELLVELVGMDLEYRWRSVGEGKPLPEGSESPGFLPPRACLSDYLAQYPALGPREQLPADLIADEYRARHLGGDRPTLDEYLTQYAAWRPTLDELLKRTDWELARLQEGTLIRDYRLLHKVGRGGMGTVYQAIHTKLDKVVAVKVLPQERVKDPEAVLRFQREMKAVGKLRHPNIVEALDAGEADGMHYLVMEYVDGCDLGKLLSARGPLPLAQACEVVRQAALGLQHAHQQERVHRDVKPSNLMLSTEGQVKVLDLGLARLREEQPWNVELSSGKHAMGTADYMAPEQAADAHAADIRADVYSLGCTLYALLAGAPPFSGPKYSSPAKKLVGHARDPVPPLDGLRPDVPDQLLALIDRMLSKSPEQRPATPGEVAQVLEGFAAGANLPRLLESTRTDVCPETSVIRQIEPRPAVAAPSRRRPRWQRWTAMSAAAGLAILAGIITIVTDRGTLEIKTLDEDVRVAVSHNGREVTIVDTATGSTVTLRSGDHEVKLVGGRNGLSLDKDRITMRRGEKEVVEVRRRPLPTPVSKVIDPPGNLTGDVSRRFLDILEASVERKDGRYVFSVVAAEAFPKPDEMKEGQCLDVIWFVDVDCDRSTGQDDSGRDYNIHLFFDKGGWQPRFYRVSPVTERDQVDVRNEDFVIDVRGREVSLSFPVSYLQRNTFEWWAWSTTTNAPTWPPLTENPVTQRATFDEHSTSPKPTVQGTPTPETTGANPERTAAECLLKLGGRLNLNVSGNTQSPGTVAELPSQEFTVEQVVLSGNRQLGDADLECLARLKRLMNLDLTGAPITNAGLAHLKGQSSLVMLNLSP